MRRLWPLLLLVIISGALAARALWIHQANIDTDTHTPERIISLSPSITETLYALGADDKLVAVTDYCDYPPQAKTLPSVGGYVNTNPERLLQYQPDLVILLKNQQQLRGQLMRLGINTLVVDNSRLAGIQEGIVQIGNIVEATEKAKDLVGQIHQVITAVQSRVEGLPKVPTMIAIAHYVESEQLDNVYIAGQNDFYNDLLELAGGQNVYQHPQIRIPAVTQEGILSLNPQVVIDVFPEPTDHQLDMQLVRQQWANLSALQAVKDDRVYIIEEDYASVPGPRIFELLIDFARLLHPHLDWSDLAESPTS